MQSQQMGVDASDSTVNVPASFNNSGGSAPMLDVGHYVDEVDPLAAQRLPGAVADINDMYRDMFGQLPGRKGVDLADRYNSNPEDPNLTALTTTTAADSDEAKDDCAPPLRKLGSLSMEHSNAYAGETEVRAAALSMSMTSRYDMDAAVATDANAWTLPGITEAATDMHEETSDDELLEEEEGEETRHEYV
jgi:hypothetical protein